MLERLTRFLLAEQTAISGVSRLQPSPIRQHLEVFHEQITNESPVEAIKTVNAVDLMIFGENFFPNTSENLVSLRLLHYLELLDHLPIYSWGGPFIMYLYRQLCRASIDSMRDVIGFIPQLHVIKLLFLDMIIIVIVENTQFYVHNHIRRDSCRYIPLLDR